MSSSAALGSPWALLPYIMVSWLWGACLVIGGVSLAAYDKMSCHNHATYCNEVQAFHFSSFMRCNWHITLWKFNVCSVMIWHMMIRLRLVSSIISHNNHYIWWEHLRSSVSFKYTYRTFIWCFGAHLPKHLLIFLNATRGMFRQKNTG